tara:strand:- start:199 stop:429 length:231 start_codon:yes stop_codon:yes gene_type:complete
MREMSHQSVVATLCIKATPERITPNKQTAFSQKRSGSEKAEKISSLPFWPAGPPKRTKLRYEKKSANAMNIIVCGK